MIKRVGSSILMFMAFFLSNAQGALSTHADAIVKALPGDYVGFDLDELGMRKEVSCRVVVAQVGSEYLFKIVSPGKRKVELQHISPSALVQVIRHGLSHPEEQDLSLGRDLFLTQFSEHERQEVGRLELTWNRLSGLFSTIRLQEGPDDDFERTLSCGGLVKVN